MTIGPALRGRISTRLSSAEVWVGIADEIGVLGALESAGAWVRVERACRRVRVEGPGAGLLSWMLQAAHPELLVAMSFEEGVRFAVPRLFVRESGGWVHLVDEDEDPARADIWLGEEGEVSVRVEEKHGVVQSKEGENILSQSELVARLARGVRPKPVPTLQMGSGRWHRSKAVDEVVEERGWFGGGNARWLCRHGIGDAGAEVLATLLRDERDEVLTPGRLMHMVEVVHALEERSALACCQA